MEGVWAREGTERGELDGVLWDGAEGGRSGRGARAGAGGAGIGGLLCTFNGATGGMGGTGRGRRVVEELPSDICE